MSIEQIAAELTAWEAWHQAMGVTTGHEYVCRLAGEGCDQRGTRCVFGALVYAIERRLHTAYRAACEPLEMVA